MSDEPIITVGERCWMLDDGLISFVDITDLRTHYMDQAANSFTIYSVKKCVSGSEIKIVHRSQLFRCPSEREQLRERLYALEKRMHEYRLELHAQEDDYIPDPDKDDC